MKNSFSTTIINTAAVLLALFALPEPTFAQAPARTGRGPQGPQVVSPEVSSDRHITFRIVAANAQKVRVSGGDIPGNGSGKDLTRGTNGVWEVTIGPIDSGAYRYNFNVDGLT